MRKILYIIVLLGLIAVPAERSDIGNLLPIEVISIYKDEQGIQIQTDTGNVGSGVDLEEAYHNLKESASGDIYLDTADYLILMGNARELTPLLTVYLKESVRVCQGEGQLQITEVAPYLSTHSPEIRLRDMNTKSELQILRQTEAGFLLE